MSCIFEWGGGGGGGGRVRRLTTIHGGPSFRRVIIRMRIPVIKTTKFIKMASCKIGMPSMIASPN